MNLIIDVSSLTSDEKQHMVSEMIKELGILIEDNNERQEVKVSTNSYNQIKKAALIAHHWVKEITG